jgi:hypothetical protein
MGKTHPSSKILWSPGGFGGTGTKAGRCGGNTIFACTGFKLIWLITAVQLGEWCDITCSVTALAH